MDRETKEVAVLMTAPGSIIVASHPRWVVQYGNNETMEIVAYFVTQSGDNPPSPRLHPMVFEPAIHEFVTLTEYLRLHPEIDERSIWVRQQYRGVAGDWT